MFADANDFVEERVLRMIVFQDYMAITLCHNFPVLNCDLDMELFDS